MSQNIDCLQIRVKHEHIAIDPDKMLLVHRNLSGKWIKGVSLTFGFHCFHGLQSENCQDYEFRAFKNCNFLD